MKLWSSSLEGQNTLFVEQNVLLDKLYHDLKDMVEIEEPHDSIGLLYIAYGGTVVSSNFEKEKAKIMRP